LFATFIGGGSDAQINPDSDGVQSARCSLTLSPYAPDKNKKKKEGVGKVHRDPNWTTPLII